MKKRILTLLLLLVLLLSACAPKDPVYTAAYNGIAFTVDTENRTITGDGNTYQYVIEDQGSGTRYTITYPDGASYTMTWSGNVGAGGGSDLYYETDRLDGDVLIGILTNNQPEEKNPAYLICGLIFIGLGIFETASPYTAWYISRGWYYKDAAPSDMALAVTRAGGIVVIILGVILLFI